MTERQFLGNLGSLRQNVVKHFYHAVYRDRNGQTVTRCLAAESLSAARFLAQAVAEEEQLALIQLEPVNPGNPD